MSEGTEKQSGISNEQQNNSTEKTGTCLKCNCPGYESTSGGQCTNLRDGGPDSCLHYPADHL